MARAIEDRLTEAGYALTKTSSGKEQLIKDILKEGTQRHRKAIPTLIRQHEIDWQRVITQDNKQQLREIIAITRRLFAQYNIDKQLPDLEDVTPDKKQYKQYHEDFTLQLHMDRLDERMIRREEAQKERAHQAALSELFTKKERHLIHRVLSDKPVSKTDYEYYSRKTKKKIAAIAQLHELAQALQNKNPQKDEELFKTKQLLEEFIAQHEQTPDAQLLRYGTQGERFIGLEFRTQDKYHSQLIRQTQITDDKLKELLDRHSGHDFR